ncbi:unnamed protein product, partial [Mycena citricolor]
VRFSDILSVSATLKCRVANPATRPHVKCAGVSHCSRRAVSGTKLADRHSLICCYVSMIRGSCCQKLQALKVEPRETPDSRSHVGRWGRNSRA